MWAREHDYDAEVAAASQRYGVPAALIKAVIGVESGFIADAHNPNDPGGAWGLMQMIPKTARSLGYLGPMSMFLTDPEQAIDFGTKLLKQNMTRTSGSMPDTISAYNGGFNPSLGFGSRLPSGHYGNQTYVDRVLTAYRYFAGSESAGSAGSFRPGPVGTGVPLRRSLFLPGVALAGVGAVVWYLYSCGGTS